MAITKVSLTARPATISRASVERPALHHLSAGRPVGGSFSIRRLGIAAAATGTLAASNVFASGFTENVTSYINENPGSSFGLIAGVLTIGAISLIASIRKNMRLENEISRLQSSHAQELRQKGTEISGLRSQLSANQTTIGQMTTKAAQQEAVIRTLVSLRDTYLSGVLSMREGDRRQFVKLLASRVLFEEHPDCLAKLLSPFPEDTALLISTAAAGDKAAYQKVKAAILAMQQPAQVAIAKSLYILADGTDKPIVDIWGSPAEKRAAEIMREVGAYAITDTTPDKLFNNAASSAFSGIRLAVVRSSKSPLSALMVCLKSDPDEFVAQEAAKRAFAQGVRPETLSDALKSRWPAIRITAAQLLPVSERAILTGLAVCDEEALRKIAFSKMLAGLTAAEADAIATRSKDTLILWQIANCQSTPATTADRCLQASIPAHAWEVAGHPKASAATVAESLAAAMKGTKVIDRQEVGHWKDEHDEYAPHDWEVDTPELSHLEYSAAEIKRATDLLLARASDFVKSVIDNLTGDLKNTMAGTYHQARVNEVKASVSGSSPSARQIAAVSAFIQTLSDDEAIKILVEIGSAKANLVLKSDSMDKMRAGTLIRKMQPGFVAELLRSSS